MGIYESVPSRLFRETFVASLYGLRTVILQRVPPCGGVSVLSHGLLYKLALHWRRVLSESVVCHQQNDGGKKQ
jgi:hypothetical protein